MRYDADHKQRTREKILKAASHRFRKGGIHEVTIPGLMRELRLTHGGFYRHFRSKQELITEVLRTGFDDASSKLLDAADHAKKGQELKAVIESYLSEMHCSHLSEGCPVAALSSEVRQHPQAIRTAFDLAVNNYVSSFAKFFPGKTHKQREQEALVLFSGMAGVLSFARTVNDRQVRNSILQQARDSFIKAHCS